MLSREPCRLIASACRLRTRAAPPFSRRSRSTRDSRAHNRSAIPNPTADRPAIAKVARFQPVEPHRDLPFGIFVLERAQPIVEHVPAGGGQVMPDFVHRHVIVIYKLQQIKPNNRASCSRQHRLAHRKAEIVAHMLAVNVPKGSPSSGRFTLDRFHSRRSGDSRFLGQFEPQDLTWLIGSNWLHLWL